MLAPADRAKTGDLQGFSTVSTRLSTGVESVAPCVGPCAFALLDSRPCRTCGRPAGALIYTGSLRPPGARSRQPLTRETDLSAERPPAEAQARLPRADVDAAGRAILKRRRAKGRKRLSA